ncbi:hypothetical protein [Leifsonia aquatica]|uniref:hypothetical protein n=1 Tax=Leifsonia aquatica TaxID=144185 RepID=UPI00380CC46D
MNPQPPADPTAITLSVVALIVAIGALAVSIWQAIIAHLNRTRPTRARWTVEYEPGQPWVLRNTGGSIGSAITVHVDYPARAGRPAAFAEFEISTPIASGKAQPIPGSEAALDPRLQLRQVGELYVPVVAGTTDDAWYPQARVARVTWRDFRGKVRRGKLRLR